MLTFEGKQNVAFCDSFERVKEYGTKTDFPEAFS